MPSPEREPVLAIVQARFSSERLPGKVLADSGMGEPLLELLIRRLRRARRLDQICVATSVSPADEAVAALATSLGTRVHRGPLEDVLTRFADAADGFDGAIARITGDCPLIDPAIVDRVVDDYFQHDCVYASNLDPATFPDGMDCEVFDSGALFALAAENLTPADREHVTTALRRDEPRFPRCHVSLPVDLSDIRLTIDRSEDLEQIRQIVRALGPRRDLAPMPEILAVMGLAGRLRNG